MRPRPLTIGPGFVPWADLRMALAGTAPILPLAPGDSPPRAALTSDPGAPDDLAVVVGTSGSTGSPKLAMLSASAIIASATATANRLGGPGQWLLTIPAHHIAGLQVLFRSLLADTSPVIADLSAGFTPAGFTAAADRLTHERRYVSLVPTQLIRLLHDGASRDALATMTVLLGGAAIPPDLLARSDAYGIRVVASYGMSETAGGCVYDGMPLDGVALALDQDGTIQLGGEVVAHGYLGQPEAAAEAFRMDDAGRRWFRTDDLGLMDATGRLHVIGRRDEVIVTGGMKVAPRVAEEAVISAFPGRLVEVLAVAVPDEQWGHQVGVILVPAPGQSAPDLAELQERLRGTLPDYALPRQMLASDALPLRGPGKPDRRLAARWLSARRETMRP